MSFETSTLHGFDELDSVKRLFDCLNQGWFLEERLNMTRVFRDA